LTFKKLFSIISIWFEVFQSFFTNNFDLCFITINSNGPAWYKELVKVALAKLFRVPIVYFYHNKGITSFANSSFKKQLFRFQFKNTKTILLSPLLLNEVLPYTKKSDVFYCPIGIINQSLTIKEMFRIEKYNITTILFFSNMIESKGVYVLLDACQILKDKNIPFRCVYVGGEGDITANQFESKVRQMGLQNDVYYQGKKYGIEKQIAFQEADIFVFPTFYHNETFGLVNLEAMQNSLPIITTNEGAISEIVIDGINGYLVTQRNVEMLVEKLEILILNPELRNEMGRAGRKMYVEKFTFEIFEKRIVEILQEVLTNKIA
jgi:glycosyltransferase involved in cell wall biosynthesis